MFTGIIEGQGTLVAQRKSSSGVVFTLEANFALTDPKEGESIACNGVCLTAIDIRERRFTVDVSPETLSRTNLGGLAIGNQVNLERALRLSDRLGGHLVSGHIDGASPLVERRPVGDFHVFVFGLSTGMHRYVIEKGSIAVDGVSLTVNRCDQQSFSVSLIPHTLAVTTLGRLRKGDLVNIELDLIGKYVERLLSSGSADTGAEKSGINPAFLAEHGFLR